MSIYAYIETVKGTPEFNIEYGSILTWASAARVQGNLHFCYESISKQPHCARPVLSGMLSTLQRDDALVLCDFTKLGSATAEVLGVLYTLSGRGVRLYVVNSGFQLDTNADALLVNMACALVAQIAKELVVHPEQEPVPIQMQREDAYLQTPTRRIRRSRLDDRRSEIELLLSNGISLSEAARRLGVSRPALTDWVESRNPSVHTPPATT